MKLSETVKLYMSKTQYTLVRNTMDTYIATVNSIVRDAVDGQSIAKLTTKDAEADLPSALKNQCIRDAKSIVTKYNKACRDAGCKNAESSKQGKDAKVACRLPVLKRPCCYINNQNFKINGDHTEFPVMVNGKCKRISVRIKMTDQQKSVFAASKPGTMRIVMKNKRIVAQVVYEAAEPELLTEGHVMGWILASSVRRSAGVRMAVSNSTGTGVRIKLCAGTMLQNARHCRNGRRSQC